MKKIVGAVFAVAALSLSACGGGAERPTADEVSAVISSEDNALGVAVPEEAADCVAQALVDSDLSDGALNALVEGDEDYEAEEGDNDALSGITEDVTKCVTEGAGS